MKIELHMKIDMTTAYTLAKFLCKNVKPTELSVMILSYTSFFAKPGNFQMVVTQDFGISAFKPLCFSGTF